MSEPEIVYHFVFILLVYCLIYPPSEFVSIGLTINHVWASVFGSEDFEFVQYHIRRTSITLVIHAVLPITYISFYYFKFNHVFEHRTDSFARFMFWNSFVIFAIIIPIVAITIVYYWCRNNYKEHPIVQNLKKYCNNTRDWEGVAVNVNAEFWR